MENYPITQTPQPVVRDTFGCSLYPSLGNEALSFSPSLGDSIDLEASTADPSLSITLPETLAEDYGLSDTQASQPSLSFCAYKSPALFVRRESYLRESGRGSLQVASNIVSARISLTERVTDLSDFVKMSFMKTQVFSFITFMNYFFIFPFLQESNSFKCSFWDQSLDDDFGGWSEEGCTLVRDSGDEVLCKCNHLTNFAILSDTSVEAEASIQLYTIIGVCIALVCVVVVLVYVFITR